MELTVELEKLLRELESKIKAQDVRGIKYAEAERDYKVALSKEAIRMKVELEYPVTLIDKVVHGCDAVAELRFKRDIEKHNYENVVEEINSIKLRIRIVEAQLKAEYGFAKYQ